MINRNEVAKEKMQRAIEMLRENAIDMWVIYSRLKTDTSLELLFNTDTKNEVLFALTRNGKRIVIASSEDARKYMETNLYEIVIVTSRPDGFIEEFKKLFDTFKVKSLALNDSVDDTRCDGLTLGLYKKLEKAIGAETMAHVKRNSYKSHCLCLSCGLTICICKPFFIYFTKPLTSHLKFYTILKYSATCIFPPHLL